jgi:hypothetical protein
MERLELLKLEELLSIDEMREQAGLPHDPWLMLEEFLQVDKEWKLIAL